MRTRWMLALLALPFAAILYADGPGDNDPDKVKPIPARPASTCVPKDAADELPAVGVDALRQGH